METNEQSEVEYLDYIPPLWSKRKHRNNRNGPKQERKTNTYAQQTSKRQIKQTKIENNQNLSQQRKYNKQNFGIRQGQTIEQIAKQMEQEQRLLKNQLRNNKELILQNLSKQQRNLAIFDQDTVKNRQGFNFYPVQKEKQAQHFKKLSSNEAYNKQQPQLVKGLSVGRDKYFQTEKESSQMQVKINYCNCQITLSLKDLKQYTADVLFIPFQTHKFQYYPGSELRLKLQNQRQKLAKAEMFEGSIYIKNKHEIKNIKYLVFLKVINHNFAAAFSKGVNSLLSKAKKDKMSLTSMLFCLDQKQIKVSELIRGISSSKQLKCCSQLTLNISFGENTDLEAVSKEIQGILLTGSDDF